MMKKRIVRSLEEGLAVHLWDDDGLGHVPVTILDPTAQDAILAKRWFPVPPRGFLVPPFLLLPPPRLVGS